MKYLSFFLLFVLVSSCSETASSGNSNETIAEDPALYELILNLPKGEYPIIDSAFLARPDTNYTSLHAHHVEELLTELYTIGELNLLYDSPKDFIKIDSIKKAGQYDTYLENLDIAMLRDARAFAIQKTNLKGDFQGMLWGITYSSYEACPAYSGTDLFFSFMAEGNLQRTLQVGSCYGVIDPPSAFSSIIHSRFRADDLLVQITQKEIDLGYMEDEEEVFSSSGKNLKYNYLNDQISD